MSDIAYIKKISYICYDLCFYVMFFVLEFKYNNCFFVLISWGFYIMKILVIGGTGLIGSAVVSLLKEKHADAEVISAGFNNGDVQVDISSEDSIKQMYEKIGNLDAVVMTTGKVKFAAFSDLSSSDYSLGLDNKLMGQVNVVRIGLDYINDGGSFTLTSGILNQEPIYLGVSAAMINGAIDGFVLGSSQELPRGLRINAVSPTVVTEALGKYDAYFPGFESVDVKTVANAYRKSIAGLMTGKVIKAGY